MNKRKIINDPVYGFITVPSDLLFDLIEHPWFQRLRRIRQLGLAEYVYPGAMHTRFHHALGAMHLMGEALQVIRSKGHAVSDLEIEGAQAAILLHDIGHGPFSHVLEHSLLSGVAHEQLSYLLMCELNKQMEGRLNVAIEMFEGKYPRRFFHQLISSQLDMDRMDYLARDSFFTGVVEGAIATQRLIKMLDVHDDELVMEEKGLLSIEDFLNARRIMYWQVYLHKTARCAEILLSQTIRRARTLFGEGVPLFASPVLKLFLNERFTIDAFEENASLLENFTQLDDMELWGAIKVWAYSDDTLLAFLSKSLLNRNLFQIQFIPEENCDAFGEQQRAFLQQIGVPEEYLDYLVVRGKASNAAYMVGGEQIQVKMKNGGVQDVVTASDLPTIKALSKIVSKFYVCWPKDVSLLK